MASAGSMRARRSARWMPRVSPGMSGTRTVRYGREGAWVQKDVSRPVPMHLRNAPTRLMKALDYGKVVEAGQRATQTITVRQGIDSDHARKLVKHIKDSKLKVQAAIQGDELRVSGKNRDDLQAAIALLRKLEDFDLPLQYVNFRD